MPALKPTTLPAGYSELAAQTKAIGDKNDCTVKAICLTTGLPYAVVHAKCTELGRRTGRGFADHLWQQAVIELGFSLRRWTSTEMVDMVMSYPKKGIAGITTHQPRRFPKSWAKVADRKLIMRSRAHVSAFVDGVVQDWAINRAKQVFEIWEVTKPAAGEAPGKTR